LAGLVSGCATWSEDGGFAFVEIAAVNELGARPTVVRDAEEAARAEQTVRDLLAQPLDTDRAVRIALINNRGLQAAYNQLGLAETAMVAASLPPNPTFSIGRIAAGGLPTEIERQIIVNILALATLPKRSEIARVRFRQAQHEAALETLRVGAEARRAYYRTAAANQTVGLLQQATLSADATSELFAELGRTGAATKIDQAREQAFYAEISAQLAKARITQTREAENLNRVLGLWGSDLARLRTTGSLPPLPGRPAATADIEAEALRRRLDVQLGRLELEALAKSLQLDSATRFIDLLELSALYASEEEFVIEDGYGFTEVSNRPGFEVELEIPLFDFGETKVRRARETYLQALNRIAELGVNARSQAREAYQVHRATYDVARLYRDEVVPLRRIVSEEALLRYNGMIDDVTDLINDTRAAIQSNVAATEALRDYWLATVDLDVALTGGPTGSAPEAMASAPAGDGAAEH
jgi:outer membrane protein TolC